EVVDAIEEPDTCGMGGWDAGEFFFEREPDRHRIHPDVLPRQTRHEQLSSMRSLDEGTESVRDLEPPLLIDFGGEVAPEHARLLHFGPQKSTAILENSQANVNGKMKMRRYLRFIFADEASTKLPCSVAGAC